MTAAEIITIIAAFGVFASSIFTGIVAVITARRAGRVAEQVVEKVDEVGKALDGRLTQWKEETSKFVEMAVERARAQGRTEGREDAKGEAAHLTDSAERLAESVIATAAVAAVEVLKTAEEKKKE